LEQQEYTIDRAILSANFACDLRQCKGACCTLPGGTGAPLLEEEIPMIERAYPAVKHLLPEKHVLTIEKHGLIGGRQNARWVQCIGDEACVFVRYEDGIAKCAIERAFYDGIFDWRKPQSCHLFPIRVSGRARNILRLESFIECSPAFERGDKEQIALVDFVEDALVRAFGEEFAGSLKQRADRERLTAQ